MNMKLFLVVPLVVCLSACMEQVQSSLESETEAPSSESVLDNSSESITPSSSEVESSSESVVSSEDSSSEEVSSSETIENTRVVTFDFHKSSYATTNYVISDSNDNKLKFLNALNEEAGEDFFQSVNVDNCQFNIFGTETDQYTLILGSRSNGGVMTLTSKYEIAEVTATVQLYNKHFDYNGGGWSIDSSARFFLCGERHNLSVEEGQVPETIDFTYVEHSPFNDVKLNAEDGRVLVHSLSITYKLPE